MWFMGTSRFKFFVVNANFKFFDYVTDVYLIFIKNSCFLLVKAVGQLILSLTSFMLL
jgi:hypothetical protein